MNFNLSGGKHLSIFRISNIDICQSARVSPFILKQYKKSRRDNNMALKTNLMNPAKMKFTGGKSAKIAATIPSKESVSTNKHIKFGDDDDSEVVVKEKETPKKNSVPKKNEKNEKVAKNRKNAMDIGTQWYQTVC